MTRGRKIFIVVLVVAVLLTAAGFGLRWGAKRVAEQRVAEFFQRISNVVTASYGEVEVDLLGFTARIHDLRLAFVSGPRFDVDQFVLRRLEDRNGFPHALDVSFQGIQVPVDEDNFGDMTNDFREMGYNDVALDLDCAWAFDDNARAFHLTRLALSGRDMGEMGLTLDLAGVDFDKAVVRQDPAALMGLALSGARLWYRDEQLLDRITAQEAKQRGMEVDALQRQLEDELDQYLSQAMLEGDEFAVKALSGFKTFLQSRDEIAITAKPNPPAPLLGLQAMSPMAAMEMLGIEVVAK